jgi:hypothetical protein
MPRRLGALGLALVLAGPALADTAQARFRVSVTVPASATVSMTGTADQLVVSGEDVESGYVVVPVRYRVTHNTRGGYLLQIAPRIGLARQVEVRGLGGGVVLQDAPVEVIRAGAELVEDLELELRVSLESWVQPGRYPFPVQLSALAL